jgi:hypothetical protein
MQDTYNFDAELVRWELLDNVDICEDAPNWLKALVTHAMDETGEIITGITHASYEQIEPEYPVDNTTDWNIRRLSKQLLSDDPKPMKRLYEGYGFAVDGNPVIIETWLKEHGFDHARAINPVYVFVV